MSFLARNARWIAGGFLLCFFSSFGQTFFIALSNADIRRELDLTNGGFGLVYMAATLASASTLPFFGRLLDAWSARAMGSVVITVLAGACLLMAAADNLAVLFLAIYLLRLFGQGMMSQTAYTATGRWFSANRGRATSLVTLGFMGGEALFPLLFLAGAEIVGWRGNWVAAAVILAGLALPLIAALAARERDPSTEPAAAGGRPAAPDRTRGEVLRDWRFYVVCFGVLAPPFVVTTLFFHQNYLTELRGWPDGLIAATFPLLSVTSVVFVLVCGWLIDRFAAVRILPFLLVPLILACLVAANVEATWAVPVFMVLVGASNGLNGTLVGALWPELYGTRHLGAIRSVVWAAIVLGSAIGPGLTGVLIDRGVSYPLQINAMALYGLVCLTAFAIVAPRIAPRAVPEPVPAEPPLLQPGSGEPLSPGKG
ncbi:MFS transporter [Antarcticirhabdus aurantiaca]|uniref:MFS transporter n=1 Tax=Antarcticirhabdus aurantiaca TaxID=2606717 RepID=A0ACD4NUW5_9HYPH|nr:MFS transporter [Antarcticirhabdus aurantiaca]WAJ30659.1 MFS transporter [Jeongeuplla avenae]